MRQFQVPQFIEVEDKIFGPLTLKQFLYIVGGAGMTFLLYALLRSFLPLFIILTLAAPLITFFFALAFYKINGQPFMKILENALTHYTNSRLYIWKKINRPITITEEKSEFLHRNNFSLLKKRAPSPNQGAKLQDLAWSIEVRGGKNINPQT
ncbi:hypothetical protein A3I27_04455 [Candidatus Giovannonibacteria bacterium RIFCSPLOWO2_02_FULL_43_11b]|uniref:PrgI family protein n=1 Tax=Candidatus Giovannonibacteria bacterium RIFCSPHIGHO2_12_FULL_43_15 TaxID=1798341 RepID=A0A1F5WPD5_9BACT|nr:MAG: hypothetical protein A2739_00815 [Candidatus Giovannonibacteria bacterium RIFCSPHIGHO2_01_FULL_43_100]OGF66740.1 MAG: hypothetical protein A3B97_02395 [Candidatus Giovannonibacteria bacterium RIFCSPHIGHO2_02_FULL_43_32]OGF77516.1 MAG: hypothetical protein A3F23_00890 [Candidatus Giovannonibacteria bacterium RIFCSPHIGHO2_12_FULL_43_15]OGF78887.1 MAG: hypothetical protein A3A15_00290 [Candidatus Giovannonibacteria bacterium RIFCSPLOWO2_01_FULL_43_60]OGF89960.1 MAG: hypothetical protein A3